MINVDELVVLKKEEEKKRKKRGKHIKKNLGVKLVPLLFVYGNGKRRQLQKIP